MHIRTEQDITGEVALNLRKLSGLPQRKFWPTVGLTQSAGCRIEIESSAEIAKPVRTLIYAIYVAGLNIDASTEEGVTELARLAELQSQK